MTTRRIALAVCSGCAALVMASTAGVFAQMPPMKKPAPAQMKASAPVDAKCQAMMAEHETMMADMKAADQRLDGLVAKMNATKGMDLAPATAAVVAEMVTQQRSMRDAMMNGEHAMMVHMMEHMQAGKESMAGCPMMKMPKKMGGQ